MKTLLVLPLALLLANTGSALAQDVRYNFDSMANFAGFKTYKWVTIKGATKLSDLVDRQIKAAVDTELATKGLSKSESDTADLYIGYQAAIGQEKEYTSFDSGWGYGPGLARRRLVRRRRRDHDRHHVDNLRGAAGAGHVRRVTSHAGLARRRQQDARHRGQAGQTAEEPAEGGDEGPEELPAQGEELVPHSFGRAQGRNPTTVEAAELA